MYFCKSHLLVVLVVLFGTHKCLGRPQNDYKVLSYRNNQDKDGYEFNYYIDAGISRYEEGKFKTVGDEKFLAVNGTYEYKGQGTDQKTYKVTYAADENGYRAIVQIGLGQQQIPTVVLASLAGGGMG